MTKTLFIEITERNTIENYWFAYFKTAEILYKSLRRATRHWYGDTSVVVPYLYCVRHALELAIKILLIRKNKDNPKYNFKQNSGTGHNLSPLWKELAIPDGELPNFESLVNSFSFDDDGKYFSYPIKKDMKKSLHNTEISDFPGLQKKFKEAGKEFVQYLQKNHSDTFKELIEKAEGSDLDKMAHHYNKALEKGKK